VQLGAGVEWQFRRVLVADDGLVLGEHDPLELEVRLVGLVVAVVAGDGPEAPAHPRVDRRGRHPEVPAHPRQPGDGEVDVDGERDRQPVVADADQGGVVGPVDGGRLEVEAQLPADARQRR
jgi:hypothetical protein